MNSAASFGVGATQGSGGSANGIQGDASQIANALTIGSSNLPWNYVDQNNGENIQSDPGNLGDGADGSSGSSASPGINAAPGGVDSAGQSSAGLNSNNDVPWGGFQTFGQQAAQSNPNGPTGRRGYGSHFAPAAKYKAFLKSSHSLPFWQRSRSFGFGISPFGSGTQSQSSQGGPSSSIGVGAFGRFPGFSIDSLPSPSQSSVIPSANSIGVFPKNHANLGVRLSADSLLSLIQSSVIPSANSIGFPSGSSATLGKGLSKLLPLGLSGGLLGGVGMSSATQSQSSASPNTDSSGSSGYLANLINSLSSMGSSPSSSISGGTNSDIANLIMSLFTDLANPFKREGLPFYVNQQGCVCLAKWNPTDLLSAVDDLLTKLTKRDLLGQVVNVPG